MAQALRTSLLSQSVGFPVKNHKGELVGKITEVVSGRGQKLTEYVILQNKNLNGNEDRFFAVPASTALIKITTGGKIVLQTDKDELKHAKRISFEKRPNPEFNFKPDNL